jgi:hypothetical protein
LSLENEGRYQNRKRIKTNGKEEYVEALETKETRFYEVEKNLEEKRE